MNEYIVYLYKSFVVNLFTSLIEENITLPLCLLKLLFLLERINHSFIIALIFSLLHYINDSIIFKRDDNNCGLIDE